MTARIKSSKNYEYFRFLSNNRKVSQRHIKELESQFDAYGNITEVSPITVNANGFVMDGQHRFEICKKRGLSVNYIEVSPNKALTPAINSHNRVWSAMDYIDFFAAYKPEYELLRQFMRINDITYPVASAVLFSGLNRKFASHRRLKDGTLEVKDKLKRAQAYMDIISVIQDKIGADLYEPFIRGIVGLIENEEFDLARFHKKLDSVMKVSPTLPNPRLRSVEDVMRNLEAIYNFKSGDGSRVLLFR